MNKTYAAFVVLIATAFMIPNIAAARKMISEDVELDTSGFTYLPTNTTDVQKLADRVDVALSSGAGGVETDPVFGGSVAKGITAGNVVDWNNAYTHVSNTTNPHNVTKTQVGLGNVDNTSDVNKPISNATQTALNGKQDTLTLGNMTASTGISVTGGTGSIVGAGVTVTNTAPDQTVSIAGGGITTASGTYPNFTVSSTEADTLASVTGRGATTTVNIGTSGNIGAGTTAPTSTLDVNGTAKMTGFKLGTSTTSGYVLTADSSGVGTWQASSGGFADPMTTRGDLIYRNASNVTARLPIGASTYVLTSDGTDVSWAAPSGGGGSMTWPSTAGIAVYNGSSAWGTSITDNSTNWNTAYGWGNHGTAGYLTAEVDGSVTNETPLAGNDVDVRVDGRTIDIEPTVDNVVKVNNLSEIAFDTTPTMTAAAEGKLYWNPAEGTLEFDLSDGSISVNKEIFEYYTNLSGTTLVEGDVVSITGVSGGRTAVTLTDATNSNSVENCVGVVTTSSVAPNQIARVTTQGTVNMPTGSYTENMVYVNPASPGKWTQTKPDAPNYTVSVGTVKLSASPNGKLEVNLYRNCRFVDAADVNGTPLSASGQIAVWNNTAKYFDFTDNINNYMNDGLTFDPTGFNAPTNTTVTYNPTNRTIQVTGTGRLYWRGEMVADIDGDWTSVAHANVEGIYYLYHNGTAFVWSTTPWTFDMAQIATVNYAGGGAGWALKETHGFMGWLTHEELHHTVGTYYRGGGDLGSYVLASTTAGDRRPTISALTISDEDLLHTLSSVTDDTYSRFTLTSTNTAVIATDKTDIVPLLTNQPYYNLFTGGAWTQALMSANAYQKLFLVAIPTTADTGSQKIRFVWVQGQTQSTTLSTIQAITPSNIQWGSLGNSTSEFLVIAEAIIRYTAGNWQWVSTAKITGNKFTQTSTPAGNYISSVATDDTLTGNGTVSSPLAVTTPWLTNVTDAYRPTGSIGVGGIPSAKITAIETSTSSPRGILSMQYSTDANGARVGFAKARGSVATPTTVATGDVLGRLMFRGYDGSNFLEMASVESIASGTVASTRVPTDLSFSTATDAAPSILTERARITNAGNVGIGLTNPSQKLDVSGTVKMTGFQLGTSTTAGRVLTADSSGVGTWQAASGGSSGSSIGATFNGGGVSLTSGMHAYVTVPFNCTINAVTVLADVSGSVTFDIKKSTYANYPTVASIVDGTPPTLSSATKYTDSTLTGWTTSVTKGDVLDFYVSSNATNITQATITLEVTK